MPMSLALDVSRVEQVLLMDGWHRVANASFELDEGGDHEQSSVRVDRDRRWRTLRPHFGIRRSLGSGSVSWPRLEADAWSHHRRSAHRGRALPAAPAEGCPLGAGRLPTHPAIRRALSQQYMSPVTPQPQRPAANGG